MHASLHASALAWPLRKFGIVRGNGHETRFLPIAFRHHGHRNPNEQFSLHLIQDAQPVRFLWHVQRVEKRLRFSRCSVEIVGDRNPIQCRERLVARPSAKELDGEIHHETALGFARSIPRQREAWGIYLVGDRLRRLCKAAMASRSSALALVETATAQSDKRSVPGMEIA
jgi:hypothetical protein